jgi:hypothetical protein
MNMQSPHLKKTSLWKGYEEVILGNVLVNSGYGKVAIAAIYSRYLTSGHGRRLRNEAPFFSKESPGESNTNGV